LDDYKERDSSSEIRAGFDLETCSKEPIHAPSAIQPYGALIACSSDALEILSVSANLNHLLKISPGDALGKTLPEVLGESASRTIVAALGESRRLPSSRLQVALPHRNNALFHVLAHRVDDLICLEIEPSLPEHKWDVLSQRVEAVIEALQRTGTQRDLCAAAVVEMRRLTGFDHVMIYRFHEDQHGEVFAEDKAAEITSKLDLHFPASDIPEQARALYLLQRTRLIADVNYVPVPLLGLRGGDPISSLDMTHCGLRSVSPIHLQYLRNMGVGASFSISLVHEQKLWGLIICHHRTPLLIPPEVRSLCDLIGQIISMLTGVTQSNERYVEELFNRSRLEELELLLAPVSIVAEVLAGHADKFLGSVAANGSLIRLNGQTRTCGAVPPLSRTLALVAYLHRHAHEGISFANNIPILIPELADLAHVASGAMMISVVDTPDDYVVWFRSDASQTIRWGGDPGNAKIQDLITGEISPRESFEAWKQTDAWHALPWTSLQISMARDVQQLLTKTLRRHADIRLAKLSYLDVLTSLPNRRVLLERLEQIREESPSNNAFLIFMDIDRFKLVNDTFGHSVGDELLIQVGQLLSRCAGPLNLVARLGGDEFVVLFEDSDIGLVQETAELILESFGEAFLLNRRSFRCTPSIGIAAVNGSEGLSIADCLNAADSAMYQAKELGGNRYSIYREPQPEKLMRQMRLQQDLFLALGSNGIRVHYQPQIDIQDFRLVGFEALLRWEHPVYERIPPSEFIPLAENTGQILALGSWALRESLTQIKRWRQLLDDRLFVSVNVSVKQLEKTDFLEQLSDALSASGMPPESLHLEITESVLMHPSLEGQLEAIEALGVRVAIDDFGTGFSSLSYLQRLSVSELKLDQSFLQGVGRNERQTLLFEAIVSLAHKLRLRVIAEGIEDETQLEAIRKCSCDSAQGYFLARPMSPEAVETLLRSSWKDGFLDGREAWGIEGLESHR
jgi:diguanylate cyclase (GGDEF)-like protein